MICSIISSAQEKIKDQLSLSYEESSIREVLLAIESQSSYRFYFLDSWVEKKIAARSYQNEAVDNILKDLLEETSLNYYIQEDNIYILPNSIVYDKLPKGFFGQEEETNIVKKKKTVIPIFQNTEKQSNPSKTKIVKIGKENTSESTSSVTLSGYVRDVKNNQPVRGLTVTANNGDIATQTDANGFYTLNLQRGLNVVETKSLQYEKQKVNVVMYGTGSYNLEVSEKIELLDAVVLRGGVVDKVEEVITGTENIDVEESKNIPLVLGERDVLKVATTLPGISTAGEGSGGVNVRGGRADQNLIMLDEAVIYNSQHFFGIFSAVNPYVLGDFTIYKGNIPAEFGGRLSSVFDMKTKNGNVNKFGGEGAIGPVTGNLKLDIPIVKEKSSLVIGGRSAYANWILNSLDEPSIQNSEASFYDVIANYTHKINDKNDIKATAYFSKDNFSVSSDSLYTYSNALGSIKWNHRFNDQKKGSVLFSSSQYEFDIAFDGEANNNFDLGYKILESELKLKMDHSWNESGDFTYGLSSKLYSANPGTIEPKGAESDIERIEIPREKALESSAFVSYKFSINDKLELDTGIRFSVFNVLGRRTQRIYQEGVPRNDSSVIEEREFGNNEVVETYGGPEFRISARYLLTPDLSLKAGFNNSYQYIHLLSNNTTISPVDTWKLSDLNIQPQQSQQYSLGLFSNLGKGYEASIEGFYKSSQNLLDFRTGADIILQENIETQTLQGDGRAYGVEVLFRKQIGKLNGWLGYTYSRSMIKVDSEFREDRINNGAFFPTNFDKPHDISMVANYKFTKRFSFSANFVYQTGRPITYPVGQFDFGNSTFTVFSERNEFRIPDFYRLDLGFNIEGNHKLKKLAHSFWSISVYNVLGRNNPYSLFFVTENGEVKALQSSIFAIPIPTITYNFKF
ncbi:TonB-dependent receptor [Aquimarina sp. ERC-38]|uniref:TonB-dependent receptor n=1 Tax=Aquimarina sp. ERC-38 TaxID=2949996 RepID=UPI0022477E61|nr:carboxypeptidase-like regulatory domain-containing protein [Aquimarina sp. ERC-38]UZO79784.1 TonB-dependent receptor [Aquimarina sp. ERC-38]